jgi:enoyl-CoA hydratase
VVPRGQARAAAEALAGELSAFPQECLRADRRSAFEQFGLTLDQALRMEFDRGRQVISVESVGGARRFAQGEGRHGQPAGPART